MKQEHFWLDQNEYPFKSKYFEVNGFDLHFIDEGEGDLLLFVHGTPSWSFDFRNIIKILSKSFRCIAIDHIGFGLSDKPESYDYSTLNHSKTLEKFINEKKLSNITLVVHDFGGPIGLNFAINHAEVVNKLIILNSWMWGSKTDPDFLKIKKILQNPLLPILYKYLNFSPRYILPKSFGDHKLSPHLRKHYTNPFKTLKQRNGVIAFAKSLLNDQEWFEALWEKKDRICTKRTLLIWGLKDPVIRPRHLEKFKEAFINSSTIELRSCGHFPQEEEPLLISKSIQEFMEN